MTTRRVGSPTEHVVRGATRIGVGVSVLGIVLFSYGLRLAAGDGNPFDFLGYFTNQTSSLTALVLVAIGFGGLSRRPLPEWLSVAWGIGTACVIVVAVVYNGLVPGTGSAPPWVSAALHVVFPLFVVLDAATARDRPPLAWRRLWWVLPYPLLWITVVLVRGATDGWVPYGFLLPERGIPSLLLHVVGILILLLAAAAAVWAVSRRRSSARS